MIDLKTQVLYLKNVKEHIQQQKGDAETRRLLSRAIYLISIGGNDYIAPSSVFESFSKEEYVGMVIGNLTSVIKVSIYMYLNSRFYSFERLTLIPLRSYNRKFTRLEEGNLHL